MSVPVAPESVSQLPAVVLALLRRRTRPTLVTSQGTFSPASNLGPTLMRTPPWPLKSGVHPPTPLNLKTGKPPAVVLQPRIQTDWSEPTPTSVAHPGICSQLEVTRFQR